MPIDFGKIPDSAFGSGPVDPIELFQSLQVKDAAINDLWLAQGDALRQWHAERSSSDVAIVLNTGAGKTLVGLLAAQSFVNETRGKVVYACSSIQLVNQTALKATGYGIDVATYTSGKWENREGYQARQMACVTTYHALFNGRSRFFSNDEIPDVIIFDDSHSAEHLLRDAFTLRISNEDFGSTFSELTNTFRPYFREIGKEMEYVEKVESDKAGQPVFIPPFAIKQNLGTVRDILLSAKLEESTNTTFAWEHIKNNFDLCCLFVTGRSIQFTPPIVPTLTLPYFQKGVRRLYLSATLSSEDAFIRTFGKLPDPIISPKTTAGECERMILVPAQTGFGREQEFEIVKAACANQKTLILVPSQRHANKWLEYVGGKDNSNVAEQVEAFKNSAPPAKLLLKARYDGVDLPGDTCRVMVIDELPSGIGTLERFLWEKLGLNVVLRSTVASRIVQSFGRISRGMSDYGVVFLTGSLLNWILIPDNQKLLPEFLQNQLGVGMVLSGSLKEGQEFVDGVNQCLDRDAGWLDFYKTRMAKAAPIGTAPAEKNAVEIAQIESSFAEAYWQRDFGSASEVLSRKIDSTFAASYNVGAWHSLWLGYCLDLLGDGNAASDFYQNAHHVQKNIPPWNSGGDTPSEEYPFQVNEVARYLSSGSRVTNQGYRNFERDIAVLDGSGSPRQTEEAIRQLGLYLGLDSRRPEAEQGTGPDAFWSTPELPSFCFELKTDKGSDSRLSKRDVGQMHNHVQWCKNNVRSNDVFPVFVGPVSEFDSSASPSGDMRYVPLERFKDVSDRLRGALEDITNSASIATLHRTIAEKFAERGLLESGLFESLNPMILTESQS